MLLPQDARHNELVCFGMVLFELSLRLYTLSSSDSKGSVVASNDIPNCIFTSLQRYKLVTPTPSIGTVSAVTL